MFYLFIYLGFYVAFNTEQVISRRVVGRAEETSTYSLLGFCTVNCRPMASNYQLSHSRLCRELNPHLRGGRPECYHSATLTPFKCFKMLMYNIIKLIISYKLVVISYNLLLLLFRWPGNNIDVQRTSSSYWGYWITTVACRLNLKIVI